MRYHLPAGVRAVVVPTLACSIVCGGAVAALAAVGVRSLDLPAAPSTRGVEPALRPPAAVVVRTPPAPSPTQAPTATVWVVPFSG